MNTDIFASRLKQALEDSCMKAADLCRSCGISRSTMSQYLSGKYSAKYDRVQQFSRVLGCSADWLAGEDVPMTQPVSDSGIMGSVPVLDMRALDRETLFDGEAMIGHEPTEECYCDGHHYVIIAPDDSMDPVIMEGDRLLCIHQRELQPGQTGVFLLPDGRAAVRQLQSEGEELRLVCFNRYYPPLAVSGGTLRVIGRVIRSMRYW